jgi:hypothetical protein
MEGLGGLGDVEPAAGDLDQAAELLELHMLQIHKVGTH